MGASSVETLTNAFIQLRDQRAGLKREYEEADFKLKAKLEKLEVLMMGKLQEFGVDSFKTPFGTVYTQEETKYRCDDWDSYWGWIQANGRMDCLEKRVGQGAIKTLVGEGGEVPPGLSYTTERVVRVRRV